MNQYVLAQLFIGHKLINIILWLSQGNVKPS